VTKAEFIERVASDDRIGSKKEATDAVEAVLDSILGALKSGEDVNFTGFGKFSVNERGPRQGVNPRTGERITIPGGKVPKFSAGAGLKSADKGSCGRPRARPRSRTGSRRTRPSAAARSASGSTPSPAAIRGPAMAVPGRPVSAPPRPSRPAAAS
jgi:DNA-binding protein HU-beta